MAHDEQSSVKVQPDILPTGKLFVLVGITVAVVLVSIIVLWQVLLTKSGELKTKLAFGKPDPALVALRAKNAQRLTQCAAEGAAQRIPVRDAMRLLVGNPRLLDPTPASPAGKGGAR